MQLKKSIKSLSWLWIGSLLGSGSTFLIYIILARTLGTEDFGLFSSSLAIVGILTLISGFGISQWWLKIFGKEGYEGIRWFKSSFKLILFSLFFVIILLFFWATFGPHNDITKKLLYVMSLFLISQVVIEMVAAKFQLEERYSEMAIWQLLPNLARLTLISLCMYIFMNNFSVVDISYIYAIVAVIFIGIGIYQLNIMYKGDFGLISHTGKTTNILIIPTVKNVFLEAWPFGLSLLFSFIYVQSDIILVKYMVGDEAAGIYNVSFIILAAVLMFPTIFYQKFLMPKLHRWANHDKKKFYEVYKKGNIVMLVSGTFTMLLVLMFSENIILFLFGKEYEYSIELLNLLAFILPVYFVAYSTGATLITGNHMKLKVKLMGTIALLNIILNLYLIPIYSSIGAAVATIICNILLLLFYYYFSEKVVFKTEGEKDECMAKD